MFKYLKILTIEDGVTPNGPVCFKVKFYLRTTDNT